MLPKFRNTRKKYEEKIYDNSNRAIYEFDDIVGKSEIMQKVKHKAKKFAKTDANVLIIGESGTGKSYLHKVYIMLAYDLKNHLSLSIALRFQKTCLNRNSSDIVKGPLRAIKGASRVYSSLLDKGTVFFR
ncbi:sigma 54-interacting transcriptional regulator [Peribacillus frigoritolerans]|nr:sigma 54-interacting transcriptional regulator [Peribacillus frigoritolerans]